MGGCGWVGGCGSNPTRCSGLRFYDWHISGCCGESKVADEIFNGGRFYLLNIFTV